MASRLISASAESQLQPRHSRSAAGAQAPPDCAVIIVSFNTRPLTIACVHSLLLETSALNCEIIVVDNNSSDGSADAIAASFPDVKLIRQSENLGFGAANNLAARSTDAEHLILLNSDTIVLPGAIKAILNFAEHSSQPVIVGGKTLKADGTLNPSSCWARPTIWSLICQVAGLAALGRNTSIFNPEGMGAWRRDSVQEVDIVSGCFMLLRRDLWARLGGFDPIFFMYGEDADLCLRAWKTGARCVICPDAQIIHYGGASERIRAGKMIRLFTAKRQLFERHWRLSTIGVGTALLDLWALTRLIAFAIASSVDKKLLDNYRTWSTIWAGRCEWGGSSKGSRRQRRNGFERGDQ